MSLSVVADTMSIEISLESEGLRQVQGILTELQKLGSVIKAVELHTIKRKDSEKNNAEIMQFLKKTGRDFVTASDRDAEEIARMAVAEVERRLGVEFSKAAVVDRWKGKGEKNELSQFATQMADSMMRAAMKKYMEQVSDRIDNQETNDPPFNEKLSEAYEAKKLKDHGFAYPIGKATAQLLDNLNPGGTAGSRIRTRKS